MRTLFTYGTLMRGEVAHHLMGGATFVREATTAPRFTLHSCGRYPALAADGITAVRGEVFHVPDALFESLDAYESDDYDRIVIALDDGEAEAYVMPAHHSAGLPIIPSGDWRAR